MSIIFPVYLLDILKTLVIISAMAMVLSIIWCIAYILHKSGEVTTKDLRIPLSVLCISSAIFIVTPSLRTLSSIRELEMLKLENVTSLERDINLNRRDIDGNRINYKEEENEWNS